MRKHILTSMAALGLAASIVAAAGAPASAGLRDSDRDGMPNSWEIKHDLNPRKANARADADGDRINNRAEYRARLNPRKARDARLDFDRDGLTNLQEVRLKGNLRDEDTDNDGQDDGDERLTLTLVFKADTDGDGLRDGDEDHDGDGIANEDEDDARELCGRDDDDTDGDDISDEDENELGLAVRVADSDHDGILDGDEDADDDGQLNEDEDDDEADTCSGDFDRDGEADEDEGDLFGTIASFDSATNILVITTAGGTEFSAVVTEDTEIEYDDERETDAAEGQEEEDELEPTTAALVPGALVTELELDSDTGTLEEIELG